MVNECPTPFEHSFFYEEEAQAMGLEFYFLGCMQCSRVYSSLQYFTFHNMKDNLVGPVVHEVGCMKGNRVSSTLNTYVFCCFQ